jgi:tetratricopeptide (TPR) repeat protein
MTAAFSMKRFTGVVLLLVSTALPLAADDFTDALQWLTAQIACVGIYNRAQTGDYTHGDPTDHYKPSDMREYLTGLTGNRTRTNMFYGACFDYAHETYNFILNNQRYYESLGMTPGGWYMAVVEDNPNRITLYDPVPKDQTKVTLNGVYVKESAQKNVQAHSNATKHGWLWVYGKDGTVYWIDPTWTDNTGYVWWGVVQNGKEVQRDPLEQYCMVSLNTNNEAFARYNSGNANMNQEKYDQAIADFNAALRLDPNYADAYFNRGIAYHGKGMLDPAIEDYTAALRLNPDHAAAYNNRGYAYYEN